MELGGPEVGRGCGGRGIIHGFETAGEARLPRLGLRLRAARLPGRRGLRRLRPADRARHVPEGHRRRLATTCSRSTSPTTSARRWSISASSAATSASPAWSSTRTTAPARRAAFARARRHPGAGRDPGRRRHPPQERELRDHRPARQRSGRRCSRSWPTNVAEAPPVRPDAADAGRAARPVHGRGRRARRRAGAGDRWTTCAARRDRRSRRSKSSTTRSERAHAP